jgi:hypothetical protein
MAAAQSRRLQEWVFGALVFSTAFAKWFDINFLERWWYAGSTRGIEISIVDLLALMLLLSTLASLRRDGTRLYWPASLGLMLTYFAYACLSVATSDPKLFGLFELTKLARGLLVFLAVAWFVRSRRDAYILLYALSAVLLCNGAMAVWQRYVESVFRAHGTFSHSNLLAGYCVLGAPVLLSGSLYAMNRWKRLLCATAWAFSAVAVVLSIARMPAAVFCASALGVLALGVGVRVDARRLAVAMGLLLVLVALFFRGFDKFMERQAAAAAAPLESSPDTVRSWHYAMGFEMAKDNPFGVGLNNWGWFSSEYGERLGFWSRASYASTSDPGGGDATQGHTLYGLTLGELGWPGMIIFSALVMQWLYLSGSFIFAQPRDLWAILGIGCFWGLLGLFLSNATEITFRHQSVYIIANAMLGFVVAARRQSPGLRGPAAALRRATAPRVDRG